MAALYSETSSTTIEDLPFEILIHIFRLNSRGKPIKSLVMLEDVSSAFQMVLRDYWASKRRITLNGFDEFTGDEFPEETMYGSNLYQVHREIMLNISMGTFNMKEVSPNLENVLTYNCGYPKILPHMLRWCFQLEELTILDEGVCVLSEQAIDILAHFGPFPLKSLTIVRFAHRPDYFYPLATAFPRLEKITIHTADYLEQNHVSRFLTRLPRLRSVWIVGPFLNANWIFSMPYEVQEVGYTCTHENDIGPLAWRSGDSIHTLRLEPWIHFCLLGPVVEKFSNLRYLHIHVDDIDFNPLCTLVNLKELVMIPGNNSYIPIENESSDVQQSLIRMFESMEHLESLHLANVHVSQYTIISLCQLRPNMKKLTIVNTDATLDHFVGFVKLEYFDYGSPHYVGYKQHLCYIRRTPSLAKYCLPDRDGLILFNEHLEELRDKRARPLCLGRSLTDQATLRTISLSLNDYDLERADEYWVTLSTWVKNFKFCETPDETETDKVNLLPFLLEKLFHF